MNHTRAPTHEPLPSIEGCGLLQYRIGSLRSEVAASAAPPLSKGMWAWRRGKWEAGRRLKAAGKEGKEWYITKEWGTMKVMAHFHLSIFFFPLTNSLHPCKGNDPNNNELRHIDAPHMHTTHQQVRPKTTGENEAAKNGDTRRRRWGKPHPSRLRPQTGH